MDTEGRPRYEWIEAESYTTGSHVAIDRCRHVKLDLLRNARIIALDIVDSWRAVLDGEQGWKPR
jgi:hypothetical protein